MSVLTHFIAHSFILLTKTVAQYRCTAASTFWTKNKPTTDDRNVYGFWKRGGKMWFILPADLGTLLDVMIIISVTAWYMGMYSLIHLFHASIYPHPHLVSVFALSLFLDYLNQLPLAPVKHCLAQVATSRLSDLDSWITVSFRVREGGGLLLFIRSRNSCIRLQTANLCYGTIYRRSNGVKSKAGES